MNWPFQQWASDQWSELWGSLPAPAETAQESAQPTPQEWASVSGQAPVKIAVLYSFTPEDEAAEAVVLDELAVLGEQGLSPWAAADRLFNAIGSGGADVAVVAPGGDGPRSGLTSTETRPDVGPVSV